MGWTVSRPAISRASGFNLVASAKHGNVRLIGVVFGGHSTLLRDNRMAQLLDQGFARAQAEKTGGKAAGIVAAAAVGAAQEDSNSANGADDGSDADGYVALPPKVAAIFPRGSIAMQLPPEPPVAKPALGTAVPTEIAAVPQPTSVLPAPTAPAQGSVGSALVTVSTMPATNNPAAALIPRPQAAQDVPAPANWGVQIGAYSDPAMAKQALTTLTSSQPQLLAKADPQIQKTGTADTPMYRARLMALDQHTAQTLCSWMIKHGQNCLTVGP